MPAVPAHILPQLAEKQQFRCPYCHNIQNVNLAPEVAHQIMSKQRQEDWEKQNAETAKQRQQQIAEWATANSNSMAHQDTAALNRLASGAGSQYYGQVLLCPVTTPKQDMTSEICRSSKFLVWLCPCVASANQGLTLRAAKSLCTTGLSRIGSSWPHMLRSLAAAYHALRHTKNCCPHSSCSLLLLLL